MATRARLSAAFLVTLLLSPRCANVPVHESSAIPSPSGDTELAQEIEREIQSPSLKVQALRFHQFVQGELGPITEQALIRGCSKNSSNPFCFSVFRRKAWASFRHLKTQEPKPFPPKLIEPFGLRFDGTRLTNIAEARRAEKQSLIKAFSSLTPETLRAAGRQSLGDKKCPNMVAVATAATLEDFFPDKEQIELASELYEHAARCMKNDPTDRENFLVRSALLKVWLKDSKGAIRILSRVHPADAYSGRPLYWLYRLYDETGDRTRAQTVYRRLRARYPFAFHTIVAGSENGDDPAAQFLVSSPPAKAKRAKGQAGLNHLVNQIEILRSFSHFDSAAVLVDWALGSFRPSAPMRLYLLEIGDYKSKVTTLPDLFIRKRHLISRATLEMAYPKAYFSLFEKYSAPVDPLLLMSIASKESKFDTLALSPANARGLMQLSPITATRLGAKSASELFDPETNIRLGATYVRELLEQWNGKGFLILANYNAGEEALASWLRRYTMNDPLLFIDLIPYRETRDYIGFVLTNYYWYRRLYLGQPIAKIVAPDIAYK